MFATRRGRTLRYDMRPRPAKPRAGLNITVASLAASFVVWLILRLIL